MNPGSTLAATEIVITVDERDQRGGVVDLGRSLAKRAGLPVRLVHVDPDSVTDTGGLVEAIVSRLSPGALLVAATDQANRWTGKRSVAEQVLERWGGLALMVGPAWVEPPDPLAGPGPTADLRPSSDPTAEPGPVLVAINGSQSAERAVAIGRRLAAGLSADLVLARVVAAPLSSGPEGVAHQVAGAGSYLRQLSASTGAESCLLRSNDPVSTLVAEAEQRHCAYIVLASTGDRAVPHATLSRVSWGLVNEAPCPVLLVGVKWRAGPT